MKSPVFMCLNAHSKMRSAEARIERETNKMNNEMEGGMAKLIFIVG